VNEIETARLQADEEELIEAEYRRASNAARLIELGQAALNALSESDDSLMTQAGQIGRLLKELEQLDPGAGSATSLHEQSVTAMSELQGDLSHYVDRIEVDPARLQELENRLNLVQALKRKYGGTVADVIAFGEEAAQKLAQLEGRDGELNRINVEIGKVDAELRRVGTELSTKRKKLIPKLRKTAESQLADLGFEQSRFDVAVATASLEECLADGSRISPTGFDGIEFQFSPNVGEPAKPLRAIASSGEIARVMLALKTVLAAEDDVPLLIFDEVDANVGGVTANAVGEKMRQIARNRQVLCITHLAPVAACADAHYVVSKQVKDGRTISEINRLEGKARVAELTRMLGGQGDAARRLAEALLK
jgi:DNA repair protein RecN (Recombination protein N)